MSDDKYLAPIRCLSLDAGLFLGAMHQLDAQFSITFREPHVGGVNSLHTLASGNIHVLGELLAILGRRNLVVASLELAFPARGDERIYEDLVGRVRKLHVVSLYILVKFRKFAQGSLRRFVQGHGFKCARAGFAEAFSEEFEAREAALKSDGRIL